MKTKLFLLSAIAGMFLMTSCSHSGPSAETKTKVAALDSSWTAMGTVAQAWGDSIATAATFCENACKAGDEMTCCEHLKGKKDSLMAPCKNDMGMFQEMKKSWEAQKPMWDSLNTKFTALKEKAAKGEGTDEEINAGLAELQAALDNGNKGLGEFAAAFNEAKINCMKNMETCKAGWSSASCSDKKCAAAAAPKKSA